MKFLTWVVGALAFVAGLVLAALYYKLTLLPWGLEFFFLIVAGGFGGIAQALASGGDRLRWPGWVTEEVPPGNDAGRLKWDAGFLADVFIGMLGAVASLMFALALLSDRFFGTVQGQQADVAIPPWARIMAFGALTGFAGRQLLPALSRRLASMVAEQVQERVAHVEKKAENRIQAAQAQAEAARLTAAAINPSPTVAGLAAATVALAAAARVTAAAAPALDWVYRLEDLIRQYAAINNPDYDARVADRMAIAEAMLVIMTQHNLTSADLFAAVQNHADKTWVLLLATLIAAHPETGAATRLFDAYDLRLGDPAVRQDSKFILYRLLLAVVALHTNRRLSAVDRRRAKGIALECREIRDDSLQNRADAVLSLLT